mgnify:CR=1 FL=1
MQTSSLEQLARCSEGTEIWWDSSPLIFGAWAEDMLKKAPEDKKSSVEKQLKVLFDYENPGDTLFCGVTTNPRLTKKVLELLPDEINPIADKLIIDNPGKDNYKLAWKLYKAITEKGAQLYMPLFEKSKFKKGYVSAQVDPCLLYTSDAADDLLCVDLGGRRIIKKKKK